MKKVLYVFLAVVLAISALACRDATMGEKRSALVETLSDGKYDKSFALVDLVGTEPAALAKSQRAVSVEVFFLDNKTKEWELIGAGTALGWVYQGVVYAPIQLFFISTPFGVFPGWGVPEISFKTYLLPDARTDDFWQKEELGEISVNEQLSCAMIARPSPIINTQADYQLGRYEDLSVGDVLYVTSQVDGRITVETSVVSEIYNETGGKLFGAPGRMMAYELGGLAFVLRDGKPELVGFLSPMESSESGTYVFYQDINQLIAGK